MFMARQEFLNKMTGLKAALVISIDRVSAQRRRGPCRDV